MDHNGRSSDTDDSEAKEQQQRISASMTGIFQNRSPLPETTFAQLIVISMKWLTKIGSTAVPLN